VSTCIQPECRYSWEPDIEREVCLDCREVDGFGDLCSTSCRDEHVGTRSEPGTCPNRGRFVDEEGRAA